jgi:uncharacterized membrane protein YkoI
MILPTVSRRFAGLVLAAAAGTGIALGAYSLGSASGAEPARAQHTAPAAAAASAPTAATSSATADASEATATTAAAPSPATVAPLTLDQAKAVATRAAGGGRVVEASEDNEPTGLLFDVTLLHPDGSAAKVEVDAATGRIVSIEQDDHWD